jgi:hypothetical protein
MRVSRYSTNRIVELLDLFSYKKWVLALALLVTWVFADDHHVAVTTNDLALVADLLDAGVYLHDVSLSLSSCRWCGRYFSVLVTCIDKRCDRGSGRMGSVLQ